MESTNFVNSGGHSTVSVSWHDMTSCSVPAPIFVFWIHVPASAVLDDSDARPVPILPAFWPKPLAAPSMIFCVRSACSVAAAAAPSAISTCSRSRPSAPSAAASAASPASTSTPTSTSMSASGTSATGAPASAASPPAPPSSAATSPAAASPAVPAASVAFLPPRRLSSPPASPEIGIVAAWYVPAALATRIASPVMRASRLLASISFPSTSPTIGFPVPATGVPESVISTLLILAACLGFFTCVYTARRHASAATIITSPTISVAVSWAPSTSSHWMQFLPDM
mmetsp:Transcript_24947/g.86907  ORF Transcript_24947/g.86907 Transcript_24947/m.86907 type:complete len:284 (-) Transcript_24947:1338-2189(-)